MAADKERITADYFDEKFKNYLRDYYTYGFKNAYTQGRSKQTVDKDRKRLNNILREYMEWSDESGKDGRIYITQDSQSMSINPFHRVYRFCKPTESQPVYFFNTIAAFSWPRIKLRGGFESLKGDEDAIKRLSRKMEFNPIPKAVSAAPKTIFKTEIDNETEKLRNIERYKKDERVKEIANYSLTLQIQFEDEMNELLDNDFDLFIDRLKQAGVSDKDITEYEKLRKGDYTLTTSDLVCYYQGSFFSPTYKNRALNEILREFEKLGIIKQEKSNAKDDNKWSLSPLTIGKLISAGEDVNPDFEEHFAKFLDFYSKFYTFGELGTFMLDRIEVEDESCFRFKQQYFMQSLNDFNIMDLMAAIEQGKWCCIKYKHATKDIETGVLCFPLEIRISCVTGREHLMYYDPEFRSYNALRIEFIDSIEYYSNQDVREALNESRGLKGEEIDADLANVRWSLKHSWGVSTPPQKNGKADLTQVKMRIRYDANNEAYILERLKRESRIGEVNTLSDTELEFTVEVTDTVELRPWVRSFYSRIEYCEGMSKDGFSLETDVDKMKEGFSTNSQGESRIVNRKNTTYKKASDEALERLGPGDEAREHEKLFNRIFSVEYYMLADGFVRLCSGNDEFEEGLVEYSKEELITDIKERLSGEEPLREMEEERGSYTEEYIPEEVEKLFTNDGFISEIKDHKRLTEYYWEYVFGDPDDYYFVNFYRDFVPLTELEIRWLKTVLSDDHGSYFLRDDEIKAINNMLDEMAPDIKPFPMEKIVYYDRQHFSNKNTQKEQNVIGIFLNAISCHKTVKISYHAGKGQPIEGEFKPVFMEFSMKKNQFQAYCISNNTDRISIFNLSRISKAEVTNNTFDSTKAEKIVIDENKKNYRSVTVKFYDEKNMVDRILTEFSPWEKTCQFDPDTGVYTLKIFYPQSDKKELVIRLLGYGADISVDQDCDIGRDIREHIEKQGTIFSN